MDAQKIEPLPAKSPEEIARDMTVTREAMSEKVAALEDQVMGTIHTAADTISNTVQAVKTIVTTGPAAVTDTVKQSVSAVTEAVKEQLDMGKRVRENPWACVAIAASTSAGLGKDMNVTSAPVAAPSPVSAHCAPAPTSSAAASLRRSVTVS